MTPALSIEEYEDLIVQSNLNGIHTKRRTKHEHELECRCESNHRKISINEVVWDIDIKDSQMGKQVAYGISKNLLHADISHSIWNTSRSYHIHAQFNLFKHPKEVRKELRLSIMRHFSEEYFLYIDKGMASEDVMIRDFNGRHEITGGRKVLEFAQESHFLNKIPEVLLSGVYLRLQIKNVENSAFMVVSDESKKQYCDFLDFCLKNRFDSDGGRNQFLFKNIAIAAFSLSIKQEDIIRISKKIASQSRGKKGDEIYNWWKWCRNQKHRVKVNWEEVKNWYGRKG